MSAAGPVRALRAVALACCLLGSLGAQAALFGDDEARKAILELRQRMDAASAAQTRLVEENSQLRRSLLELQNQIDSLRAEIARMRGQEEQLTREVSELQRRQRDLSQGVDERLRKFEPLKVTVDGQEFLAEVAEKQEYEAALAVFRSGDFAAAQASLVNFARRYPKSGYMPSTLFWLGNAQYATRDYKEAVTNFRSMLAQAPDHSRAPEAALSIANCQIELKDSRAARRTLEELVKAYPQSEAAQAGRERLSRLR
jgi:tol-pal system protein YbgF